MPPRVNGCPGAGGAGGLGEGAGVGAGPKSSVKTGTEMMWLAVSIREVGGHKSDVLLRVVSEQIREKPEHEMMHPHGYRGGSCGMAIFKNCPKGKVRLRMAADIPVSPGPPKPLILSELLKCLKLQQMNIQRPQQMNL